MADVFDLVDHLNEEPPAHRIMAWRFLKPKTRKLTEEQIQTQHSELSATLGQAAGKMPEQMKEMLRWMEEQQARLNKNRTSEEGG